MTQSQDKQHDVVAKAQVQPQVTHSSIGAKSALVLSVLALLGAGAVGGFQYWSYQQSKAYQPQSQADNDKMAQDLRQIQQSLQELDTLKQAHQKDQTAFDNMQQQLQHTQAECQALKGDKERPLAEIGFLVFMANERLQMADDPIRALAQLKLAQNRLASLSDPNLQVLKTAIERDVKALNDVVVVDKPALWLELEKISSRLSTLSYQSLNNKTNDSAAPVLLSSQWQQALRDSWQEIKDLIKVSRLENNPIPAAFTAQEKQQIIRSLQFYIEQAQWALLHNNVPIYQTSLKKCEEGIRAYFENSEPKTQLLAQLATLQQQTFVTSFPDLSETLKALDSSQKKS